MHRLRWGRWVPAWTLVLASLAVAGCDDGGGASDQDGGQDASGMDPDAATMDSAMPMDGGFPPEDAGDVSMDSATQDASDTDASDTEDASDTDSTTGCASGTQDNDGDGTCTADCSQTTCDSNATCDDSTGTATCACDTGYQDNDDDGDCSENCATALNGSLSCPANSTCSDASGAAGCECDFGYQDNDDNGSCEPGCGDDTCSYNGVCDEEGGVVSCECDFGYEGQACDACVPGLQDHDADGTCEAACLMPGDYCVEGITPESWGQDEADSTCPDTCMDAYLQWNGQWTTAEANVNAAGCESGVGSSAVCGCELPAVVPGDYCVEGITPESWGQAEADADCPDLCAGEGLQWSGGWSTDQSDVEAAACTSGFGAAAVCGCDLADGYCSAPEQVCDDTSGTPECSCAEGYYDDGSTCQELTECVAGTYETAAPTATSDRECTACAAGEHCAGGSDAPESCNAGVTWDHDGDSATACVAVTASCAAGSYETTAPTVTTDRVCTACEPGEYCAGGTTAPESCDAGTTWDHDGDPATACVAVTASCDAGTYEATAPTVTADRDCTACNPGEYCAGGTAAAVSCDAGTTWDHDGNPATACVAVTASCAAGSYESTAPTTTVDRDCTACNPGEYCAGGTAAPASCNAGTTWDHDGDPATACVAVTASCEAGTYETTAPTVTVDRECTACDPGEYCAGGTTAPVGCEVGVTWDDDGDPSTECVAVSGPCSDTQTEIAAPTATSDRVCSDRTSCLAIKQDDPSATDGTYDIDPDGAGAIAPFTVYCDMTTDGGGYTFYKVDAGTAQNAADAETACASRGMQLFIPRTEAHLQSAYDVATDATYGPSGQWEYLYILGIYPDSNGATCSGRAFQSTTSGCNWSASDGGPFWVSDRTDIGEPNGDNTTTGSMYYWFGAGSYVVTGYNDITAGYTSRYYMCDTGDKLGWPADCAAILTANPSAPDGTYTVDPDGSGGNDPVDVTCDMTTDGGGWTVVTTEDFAGGATGWSNNTTSTCGSFGEMLGGYGVFGSGAAASKSFDLLGINHTELLVSLDYIKVDTWDNETAIVQVDGTTVFSRIVTHNEGATSECGRTTTDLSIPVAEQVAHTDASVTVNVTSTLDQGPTDESFGFDNVQIRVR